MVGTFGFGSGGGIESGVTAHASTHLNGSTDPIGNLPLLNVTQTFSAYQTLSAGLAVQGGTTLTGAFNLVTSGNTASITGNTSIVGGLTVSAGLTLSSGGISITGNSSVAGTFSTTGLYTASGGISVSSGGLTVSSGTVSFNTGATIGTGQVLTVQAGTAAAPSIVPTGNTNTGVWFPATSTIAWSTAGTERVRIDSSGNVGIGTTSPGSQLDVVAQDAFRITGYQSFLTVRDSNSSNRGFRLQTAAGDLLFETDASGVGTYAEKMRLSASGNVGIGTSSPQANLHVTSGGFNVGYFTNGTFASSSNSTLLIGGGDAGLGGWENVFLAIHKWGSTAGVGSSSSLSRIRFDATSVMMTTDNGSSVLWAGSNGTYSGRVGIGTSSPAQLLDVAGTARATNFIPSGLTGATTAVRIVGGTTNAPPASGTFVAGDMVIGSTSGAIYICTTGGTPGNWTTVGSGATTVFNKTFLLMGG